METGELRIGNYINLMLNDEDYDTIQVGIKDLVFIDKKQGVYEPIPLTEEWLLKLGFEKERMNLSKYIDLFGGGKKITFSGDYLYIIDSEKPNTIPTDIIVLWNKDVTKEFYVHQLQNLYFSITREELILKSE